MVEEVFRRFEEKGPVLVLVRAAMEFVLGPRRLDEIFAASAVHQYERELLFSSVFALMCRTVCGSSKSVHAAYLDSLPEIAVSVVSIYNKLQNIGPETSAALVRETAGDMTRVIDSLPGGRRASWVPGYRVRLLDGNCLAASEHRLKELRGLGAGALPGKSLVVFDPSLEMAINVFPCEDGHAQERALLKEVLPTVERGELWIEDRNMCTRAFVTGVVLDRGADLIVREHQKLPLDVRGPRRKLGRIETGMVFEEPAEMTDEQGRVVRLRRIIVELDQATRDGDWELRVLTSLPASLVRGQRVAELYRLRWTIETAFQHLEKNLRSEINTLAYPKAALFGFCVALVAFNVLAVVLAALRSVHGEERIATEVSGYHLANQLASKYEGMMIALPAECWAFLRIMSITQFANFLHRVASNVDLRRYRKSKRGPKKPPTKRVSDPDQPHVSTAQLLARRRPLSHVQH